MISKNSKIFVSFDGEFIEMDCTKISDLIAKSTFPYAMSYHNGFGQFDCTKIEKAIDGGKRNMVQLIAVAPNGAERKSTVSEFKKVFTVNRGYIEANRLRADDVLVDFECRLCKVTDIIWLEEEMDAIDFTVLYNRSYFCDGILMRSE